MKDSSPKPSNLRYLVLVKKRLLKVKLKKQNKNNKVETELSGLIQIFLSVGGLL